MMSGDVLRLWLSSSVYGETAPFYMEGFRRLGKELKLDIELKIIPWSRSAATLISAFKNGNPPDIFELGTTVVQTMAHLEYLAPVPDEMKLKPSLADWVDGNCAYKGRRVAVPWLADTVVMAARQDILDRYDISRRDVSDRAGFYRVCEMLADDGGKKSGNNRFFPMVFPIRPDNWTFRYYVSWLLSSGWKFPPLTPIPANIFENDTVIETFEYISRLIQMSGITTKDVRLHPQHLFEQFASQGRYVFFTGSWVVPLSDVIKRPWLYAGQGAEFSILPIPSLSPEARPWGGGSTLAVSSGTKFPEAAWKVVEYMYSDSFMDQWTSNSGDVPAFQSAFWDRSCKHRQLGIIYEQIKKSGSYPMHPMWLHIEKHLSEDFANFLWRMMNGRMTDSDTTIRSTLHNLDRSVIDFLRMTWEMDNV